MALKDIVYIYDKETYIQSKLGEIQKDFNISPVIDSTKDSCKVVVNNFSSVEIEPYSIIQHRSTKTWWVVKHDKITRSKNENGFWYEHELILNGAIELLNARDLTDSGFNQNRYDFGSFFARVLKHSNFEFKDNYNIITNNNIALTKNIDYLKTFENYTPLSAIREFLDGYNCVAKLSFNTSVIGSDTKITSATFTIKSKTGDANGEIYQESYFKDIREVKTVDKESFGTSVISNADNVVSVKAKTYPSTGSVKITGTGYTIKAGVESNAVIRLPSNIFKVNWVDMVRTTSIHIFIDKSPRFYKFYNFICNDKWKMEYAYNKILEDLVNEGSQEIADSFKAQFPLERLKEYGKLRFYYCDNYDPINDTFTSDYPIPIRLENSIERKTVLSNSELKNNVSNPRDVFCYERGKDYIGDIQFFYDSEGSFTYNKAYFRPQDIEGEVFETSDDYYSYHIAVGDGSYNNSGVFEKDATIICNLADVGFIVNYIPMSDIKIKLDNQGTRKDSQLYNQTGKLTDSVAFSKQLLSYAKEIESDNITKYGDFYYTYHSNGTIESNIPKVGSLVEINGEYYVINNISMDFFQNETLDNNSITYYVSCEFTMSKNIAVKSLMVNPNTNIRDYGIPQNNNVKRKQLYRDFYELDYSASGSNNWYQPLSNVLSFSILPSEYKEHIGVMKITFSEEQNNSTTWYYQLESTTFFLKKNIYEIIDFKDNNIIGYGSQNVWSGFDLTRILTGMYDLSNTPISYVDDNGEFVGIDLLFVNNEDLTDTYSDYLTGEDLSHTSYGAFYSCFIPSSIYTSILGNGKYDFRITENKYEKDALEVPVFEYSCQVDDTKNIIIGSNIFDNFEDDSCYAYAYVIVPKAYYDDNNFELIEMPTFNIQRNLCLYSNAVKLEYNNDNEILIKLYNNATINVETGSVSYGTEKDLDSLDLEDKDIIIIKHTISIDDMPNHSTLFFQFGEGIESIYYSIDNGLTFRTLLNNYQIDVLTNDSVYWYASPLFGFELDYGVPDSEDNAEEVVVDENKTILPTATKITYTLSGTSTNGTVLWYPNQAYVEGTEITQADYLDTVYYKIVANTGYDLPQNYIGSLVVNTINFEFSGTYALKTFDPCTIKTFSVALNVGTGAALYYSLNEGVSFTSVINSTTLTFDYGQRIYWYATINASSHYELDNSVPSSEENAELVIVNVAGLSLDATTQVKTYTLLPDTITNGTISWFPNSAYVVGTEISSADYGTTVYYQINANTGYNVGGSTYARGSKTINTTDFTFNEINNTATAKTLPNVSINTYSVSITKGANIISIVYSTNNGSNWTTSATSVSLTLSYGTKFYWYANIQPNYEPSAGTPTSQNDAEYIYINANVTRTASATKIAYNLLGISTNGSVTWYSDSNHYSQISNANYGDTVYYVITPNTGYQHSSPTGSLVVNTTYFTISGNNATHTFTPCTIITYNVTITKGSNITSIVYSTNGGSTWTTSATSVSISVNYGTNFYWYANIPSGYQASSGTPTSSSNAEQIYVYSNVSRTASATQIVLAGVSCSGIGTKNASVYVNATTSQSITVTQVKVYYGILEKVIFTGSYGIAGYGGHTFTGTTTINLSDGDYAQVSLSNGQTVYGYF